MQHTHTDNKNDFSCSNEMRKVVVLCLLLLNLILVVYVAFFKKDAIWLETLKSGGKENFQLVQQLYQNDTYKKQQAQTLNQILASMNTPQAQNTGAQNPTTTTDTTPVQTLDKAKIDEILKDAFVQGKANTRFVLIEYSDMLCPFCKRHYESQTVEQLVKKYPNDIALVFKNMPLVQLHPTAFKGAEGLACAGKLGGQKKYYAYLPEGFKAESFDDTSIIAIAKRIGIDSPAFENCIKNGEMQTQINASIQEGQTVFGINGTPGNVILDKQTGKYVIISGAYPFDKFDQELQNLMK